jgi:hypothetical protein
MNKHYHPPRPTYIVEPAGRRTSASCRRTSHAVWTTRASPYLPRHRPGRPQMTSTKEREKARSIAGVIAARLLAVLVVAMVITSILGFTAFDRQAGNSTTAIASLAIGGAAAVLGLSFGFLKAYQVS